MAKEDFRGVIFVLAIFYTVFCIVSIIRLLRIGKFIEIWKGARLLYILIFIQTLFRLTTSWVLAMNDNQHNLLSDISTNSILVSAPEALFIGAYMVLIWVVVSDVYNTRLATHDISQDNIINPLLNRVGRVIKICISIWLICTKVFFCLVLLKILNIEVLNYVFFSMNIGITTGVILAYFYQEIKFSGVPFKTLRDERDSRKIFVVAGVWMIGRSLHALIFMFERFNIISVSKAVAGTGESNTLNLLVYTTDILLSELLCIYLVLETSFFKIFLSHLNHFNQNSPLLRMNFSIRTTETQEESKDSIDVSFYQDLRSKSLIEPYELEILQPIDIYSNLGTIYQATYNNRTVFLRRIQFKRYNSYLSEGFLKDIQALKTVSSSYILPTSGSIHPPSIDLISPYKSSGSLHSALHTHKVSFSTDRLIQLARDISEALRDIHSQGWVHGHLTSHNILLRHNGSVVISDLGFGYLRKFASADLGYSNKSAWSSPEMLKDNSPICIKAMVSDDVYSYGMILWEIFSGLEPFTRISLQQVKVLACEGYRPNIPDYIEEGIKQLIKSCWNVESTKRPEFSLIYNTLCLISNK